VSVVIYDALGRPVETSATRRPDVHELAVVHVRDRWSNYPSNGLTPERLARIFREADHGDMLRQAELFEEMEEKDAHLASQFQVRKLAVQGLPWEVTPRTETARARETAAFCRDFLDGFTDFEEHVLDLLDALAKGYSTMEILWETSAGQSRIRGLRWVHPKKVTFWDSVSPRILTAEEPVRGIDPPPFKFVYHRYKARSGHDTRSGLMRVCAWMYLFKNYSIKDWVAFAEIYGMPLRIGRYEPGASRTDREALVQAVRSLGTDAAGVISKSTEIEFIETQRSSSQNVYESLARFCDAQTSKAVLGQTLTSEAGSPGGTGSYALGRVHGEVRHDLVAADCRALGKTITQQILGPLVGFNYGWDAPVPRFAFLFEPPEDLRAAAETYRILAEMGFDLSQEHLSQRFKVPVRKPGEKPLAAPLKNAGMSGARGPDIREGAPKGDAKLRAALPLDARPPVRASAPRFAPTSGTLGTEPLEPSSSTESQGSSPPVTANDSPAGASDPGQESVDAMAHRMNRGESPLAPLFEAIFTAIEEAGSYEELLESVYARYDTLHTARLQEALHRAVFAANLLGYLTAAEESRS